MSEVPLDILEKWSKADRIQREFYEEKAKVDTLVAEILYLCNKVISLKTKQKSVSKSIVQPKLNIQ